MLTLEQAIEHCHEKAEEIRKANEEMPTDCKLSEDLCECAFEHEQLAKWLTELQERREADRWIPVSERLPEDYTKVLITNEYGVVTCVIWNTWYQNEYEDAKKEYKAIAWKPVPKPYESEAENGTDN